MVEISRPQPYYGIELDLSTLADWVGAAAAMLMPLVDAMRSHVFAAERIHDDDARARRARADYGPMCATTRRSGAATRMPLP